MSALAHLSTDMFPLLILVLIFMNNRRRAVRNTDQYWFKLLNLSMILYFLADIFYWETGEMHLAVLPGYVWTINVVYQILEGAMACFWFNYVYSRLHAEHITGRILRNVRIVEGLYAVYLLLAVTSPWTKLMFDVTKSGTLLYGPLYSLQYGAGMAATMISLLLVIHTWRHAEAKEVREDCRYLTMFCLITFGGVFVQFVFAGWWIAESCIAVSILVIYINSQNRKITTDSLTRLNNRREFDQYLLKKAEQTGDEEFGMLMLDLDNFKAINDTYGHAEGDETLWRAADILRNVAGVGSNFLARYGGDEFVIVGDWKNQDEIEEVVRTLEQETQNYNGRISFSIGHALWSEITDHSVEKFIEKADERMYLKKKKKKGIL